MFGRNKPDEMEREINSKSMVISNIFTVAVLAVWVIFCAVTKRPVLVPLYILLAHFAVRGVSKLILKRSVGDDRWKKGAAVLVAVALAVALLLMISVSPSVTAA